MPRILLSKIREEPLRLLFYGYAGAGKTYLCGSAIDVSEMLPIFYADTDGGLMTVEETFLKGGDDKITVWKITLDEDIKALNDALFSPNSPYKTVVLDGMTAFYDILMTLHLRSVHKEGETPQIQDYGAVGGKIQTWLTRIKDRKSGPHFITTAGEMFTKDEITGIIHVEPDFVGKLSKKIPKFFDLVGYLTSHIQGSIKEGTITSMERRLQVQPFKNIRAKDRTPNSPFGLVVVDPTMRLLYEGMLGKVPIESSMKVTTKQSPQQKGEETNA